MSTCARCGATFSCAMVAGEAAAAAAAAASNGNPANVDIGVGTSVGRSVGASIDTGVDHIDNVTSASSTTPARCWCTYLPAAAPLPSEPGGACWCPTCLRAQINSAAELRNGAE